MFLAVEIFLSSVTLFLNTFLGLVVFVRNTKSWTNRFFLALALLINCYLIANYISLHPPESSASVQLFWIRLVMFVTSFIGPTLFFLVHTFPSPIITLKKGFRIFLLSLCFISAALSLTPFVFSSIQYPQGKPVPTPGPAIPIFFLDFAGLFLASMILLVIKYRKSKGIIKLQLFYFLLGIISTFSIMAVSTVVFVVIFHLSDFVFWGPISALFLIAFVAYAIVKHRFLDIRLVIARLVAYVLLLVMFAAFYIAGVFFISNYLLGINTLPIQAVTYTLLTLFVAFTFQPFKNFLEEVTDRIFFKGKYDSNELVLNLTEIMAATLRLEDLTKRTLDEVMQTMKIADGVFFLFKGNEGMVSFPEEKIKDPKYDQKSLNKLFELKRVIIHEEEKNEDIRQLMRNLDIAVSISLFEENHNEGVLVFGEKKSGEAYSKQDIQVLEILGPEVSVAIRNAQSYEEISKFNLTLKDEVQKATKDLKNANEKLKELDRLKDEFVSLASHELRTPMTAIKSYLWMSLRSKDSTLSEKQKTYIERAYTSVDRLIKLVNDMLNISRIESGRLTLEMKKVDIGQLIKEVLDELLPHANELGLHIDFQSPPDIPPVIADADKVKEVVFNLIGNSMKFTPKDGQIAISISQKGQFVEVSVKDTGSGIASDNISKLFQKFGMLPESYVLNQTASGTGLGLYICRSIIEMHKGKIWATSEGIGKGAEFSFTLKVYDEKEMKEINPHLPSEKNQQLGIIHTQI